MKPEAKFSVSFNIMLNYGGMNEVTLSMDILRCILNQLEEEHWYKLKYNSKILDLMTKLHKTRTNTELSEMGCRESLPIDDSRHIFHGHSLNVSRRERPR